MNSIHAQYIAFTGGADEMDGRQFAKLCKDCKLLDKKLTQTSADLSFAKYKPKGARKIAFSDFEVLIQDMANKKMCSVNGVLKQIAESEGPILTGTKAEYVKFYDDKNTYTGVHQFGGPSTVDAGRTTMTDLSQFADRTPHDVRGIKVGVAETNCLKRISESGSGRKYTRDSEYGKKRLSMDQQYDTSIMMNNTHFDKENSQLNFKRREYSSRQSDSGGTRLNTNKQLQQQHNNHNNSISGPVQRSMTDRLFAWYDVDSDGLISQSDFENACEKSRLRGCSSSHFVLSSILDPKRFEELDIDGNGYIDRAELAARLRHLVKEVAIRDIGSAVDTLVDSTEDELIVLEGDDEWEDCQLRSIYLAFTANQHEMDGRQFWKMCRDAEIAKAIDADLAFASAKSGPTSRRLSFSDFRKALPILANRVHKPYEYIFAAIVASGGPVFIGTKPDAVRFHDDKDAYTGMYKYGGPDRAAKGQGFVSLRR